MSANPYESPPALDPATNTVPDDTETAHFVRERAWANWARALLATDALLSGMLLVCLLLIGFGPHRLVPAPAALLHPQELLWWVRETVYLGTIVVFLCWFHQAYRNLLALGCDKLNFTPRSAVVSWFIPVLNLVDPFLCTREIWRASNPSCVAQRDTSWKDSPEPWLVNAWWVLWFVDVII